MGLLYLYLNFLETHVPRQTCSGTTITLLLISWNAMDNARSVIGLL